MDGEVVGAVVGQSLPQARSGLGFASSSSRRQLSSVALTISFVDKMQIQRIVRVCVP